MADVLIREVPDAVLACLDAHASRLGLSRVEYIRRRLAADAATSHTTVSVEDLQVFGKSFVGLVDDQLMDDAWR